MLTWPKRFVDEGESVLWNNYGPMQYGLMVMQEVFGLVYNVMNDEKREEI